MLNSPHTALKGSLECDSECVCSVRSLGTVPFLGKYDTELDFLGNLQRKDGKVFIESVETELVRKWVMCVIGNF